MKRLTKSAKDRQVSGVLGGIAEYFGIDSTIVRVIFLIFAFAGVGSPVFLYILLAILLPEPSREDHNYSDSTTYSRPRSSQARPRKEAKPVTKEKEDDDWSDF
ncbi:PspC domain-containing protein [Jeotgalibaca caeni]|uniref:PspC domain-containing protein n=1 Tax=Jeotgalibaca caeni TaxID=3028623 RepID=UPI00237D76BF|nr:PspC domain-containing protein [Jeotgalibaca caeni]MDE1547725.1 PspC domain-containing protein [Jeotgalibaca caeni]